MHATKRAFDVVVALTVLVLTAPVVLAAMAAIVAVDRRQPARSATSGSAATAGRS